MPTLDDAIIDFKRLDQLSYGDSHLHRLDARAKVLVTAVFTVMIISYDKYELAALAPFVIYPASLIASGNLPALYIARKVILLCPFIFVVAIFNPLFDRQPLCHVWGVHLSGGWISFLSIIARSLLTVGTAFTLVGLTGFNSVCAALGQLGMPKVFTRQLMFLYRYIFVLTEEGARVFRARELRASNKRGTGIKSQASLIGHLLLRTWQRSERVHSAMLARGFTGEFKPAAGTVIGAAEIQFMVFWIMVFVSIRFFNIPHVIGTLLTGSAS